MQQADGESAFFRGRINIALYTEFWEPPILEIPEKDVTPARPLIQWPEAPRCARKRSSGEKLQEAVVKLKRVAPPNAQRVFVLDNAVAPIKNEVIED